MKKLITTITIVCFLNLFGCYYQEQLNPSEYSFDESTDLKIVTTDSVYNLQRNNYYLKDDTLFATLKEKLDAQTTLKTKVEIPTNEIEIIE